MEHLSTFKGHVLDRINGVRAVLDSRRFADRLTRSARAWASISQHSRVTLLRARLEKVTLDLLPRVLGEDMKPIQKTLQDLAQDLREELVAACSAWEELAKSVRGSSEDLARYDKQVPAWIESEEAREACMQDIFRSMKLSKKDKATLEPKARECILEIHDMLQVGELDGVGIPDAAERAAKGRLLAGAIENSLKELRTYLKDGGLL